MNPYQLFRKLLPHFPGLIMLGKGYVAGNEQVVMAIVSMPQECRTLHINVTGLSIVDWQDTSVVTLEEARIRHA